MTLPSVAVIIPTRNRPELLKRCLSRLVADVGASSNLSIVVSDDGDASITDELLHEELATVQIVQGPQRGPSSNRNCGAAHATADLLVFLDDDCIPDQNLVAIYQDAAMRNPAVGVFEGRISATEEAAGFADAIPANESGGCLWSCNFAIRRELFVMVNGFDERYPFAAMEDVDLYFRVKKHSEVLFLPNARVWHEPEPRLGWRIVQHHSLSVLLFLHLYGPKAVGKGTTYFLRMAARILVGRGVQQIRARMVKNPGQLFFQVWANLQLALIVFFWRFHACLARWFYPPCCPGCETIHASLASLDHVAMSLREGTDAR
jgi:GT2 family glycosyltransferase